MPLVTIADQPYIILDERVKADLDNNFALSSPNVVGDTTPQLGGQLDVNGKAIGDGTRELITFTEDGSAVNQVNIENEATGGGPIISAAGDDTNIDLNLTAKGTGSVILNGAVETPETTTSSGAGAVAITGAIHEITTTGADALTLADGAEGQHLFVIMVVDGGDGTLTPTNLAAGTNIVFDNVGDSVHLLFTNSTWQIVGGHGYAVT